tara:strand:+ start:2862 stop:4259 length:1398 start_codon:yes stop_codon:yes gene_type:complete
MKESICVVPFWSQAGAMNWDSNYAYLRKVLPVMADLNPETVWTMLWPQQLSGQSWKWQDDGLFDHPRIFRYPWSYPTGMRQGVMAFDPQRFKMLEKDVAPTMYWLHQVEMGIYLYGGYAQTFGKFRPRLIAQHHYIIHPSLPYPMDAMLNRQWMQIGGSIASNKVVCNSHHTKTMMMEAFGELINKEQMDAIEAKTEVLPFGLTDKIPDTREHDKPVIIYNHRSENYKRPRLTAKCFDVLRNEGLDFEVWATQYQDQKLSHIMPDKIVGHPEYARYLENIAVPAINTINSTHETFCIAILDSMSVGHVIVAPKGVTFVELAPEGYPYLFKNEAEQIEMMREILSNWPQAYLEWSQPLKDRAVKVFGLKKYCEQYTDLLASQSTQLIEQAPKAHTLKALNNVVQGLSRPTPVYDVAKAIRKTANLQHQSMPDARVVAEMAKRGVELEMRQDGNGTKLLLTPTLGVN